MPSPVQFELEAMRISKVSTMAHPLLHSSFLENTIHLLGPLPTEP